MQYLPTGHQIGVSNQFGKYVLMRVVGIQGQQYPINAIGMAAHLLDDLGGLAIVGANVAFREH